MHKLVYKNPEELASYQGRQCFDVIKNKYLSKIQNKSWRELIKFFYTMKQPSCSYKYDFCSDWDVEVCPGSGAHQAHYGGLALHLLQDFEYAQSLAEVCEKRNISIDYDLLYTTIALHDSMKRFLYRFDENFVLQKSEDPFIAKEADHHSLLLQEMAKKGCEKRLMLSVAAIHGIDDVSLKTGVINTAVVNHYLQIGKTGLSYTDDDVIPEHNIAFLSDSDWFWSGRAQTKAAGLAHQIALRLDPDNKQLSGYLKLYLGSRFTFEAVGDFIEKSGSDKAADYYTRQILSD